MESFQGPALWAYNNAVFTDLDFENLEKLSGATKETETNKIGRFGLGFNAIYNITDVPSFISQECVAIFDPHMMHLASQIKQAWKPGIKLNMHKHSQKIKEWKNQFIPFNGVFNCRVAPNFTFNATLFRFPLRTEKQARESDISKEHYNHDRIVKLLKLLHEFIGPLVLFTQNVLKVSVYHLDKNAEDPSNMELLFAVMREPKEIIRSLNPAPSLPVMNCGPKDKEFLKLTNILRSASSVMKEKRKEKKETKRGLSSFSTVPTLQSSALVDTRVTVTQTARLLLTISEESKTYSWLACSSTGNRKAFQMALDDDTLSPVGGVAMQVCKTISSIQAMPMEKGGTAFCFLPLPITLQPIPAHINGYFAVTSSRRALCTTNPDDLSDTRGDWNKALATDPICKAYVNLCEDLARRSDPKDFTLECILPNTDGYQSQLSEALNKSLFKGLIESNAKVFTDGAKFASFADIGILDPDFRDSLVGGLALKVMRSYSSKVIVDMPNRLLQAFYSAGCEQDIRSKVCSMQSFYKFFCLPNLDKMNATSAGKLISYALLSEQLIDLLRGIACIPVSPDGKSLRKASELIDPRSSIAALYSFTDGRFPMLDESKVTSDHGILSALHRLGMISKQIPWPAVVERCRSVATLNENEGINRATALIKYMQNELEHQGEVNAEWVKSEIRATRFLPRMRKPASFPLKWKESGNSFISPNDAYLEDHKKLVCCIEPLVARTVIHSQTQRHVTKFLGLTGKKVSAKQLFEQLKSMKETFDQIDCPLGSKNEYIADVYSAMQEVCKGRNAKDKNLLRITFQKYNLLYVNNSFESPLKYAFRCHGPCWPFLLVIPAQFVSYREFLTTVGVREQFEYLDYISVLKSLKTKFGTQPLPDEDTIEKVVGILQCLCRSIEESKITVTEQLSRDIYVPDTARILQQSSEMCYNNCQGFEQSRDMKLTHSKIAHSIAETLHMKTIRQDVLGKHSRKLGSKFGQREKLTNRINRILKGYPRDSTIMKEMLQNADDAGATKMDFILDTRSHGTEQVFEESWKPLQGPALCVYNNRPFTEADLQGIQDLGEGSKGDTPYKTGQYGIGFNCVYHLTDTPMFITKGSEVGENLCVFDPHCKYVPGADQASPGMKYTDFAELSRQFPDIFSCFLEETGMFDLNNATLFRFPFRTREMEATVKGHIASYITEGEVRQLLDDFCKELPDCILFLNNLKTVRVFEMTESGPTLVYEINARISDGADSLHNFLSKITKFKWLQQLEESDHIMYTLIIEDNKGLKKEYRVGQQVGYTLSGKVPSDISLAYQRGDLLMLPRGGVAFMVKNHNSYTDKEMKSRLFCFLPLPMETKLPDGVHINGHFALASENRNELWKPSVQNYDMGYNITWNHYLMKGVIAPLYALMLQDRTSSLDASVKENPKLCKALVDQYVMLFPSHSMKQISLYTDVLYDSLYSYLHSQGLIVLPIGRPNRSSLEWHSTGSKQLYFDCLQRCEVLKESTAQKSKQASATGGIDQLHAPFKVVQMILLQSGMNLLSLVPLRIHDSFKEVVGQKDKNAIRKIKPKDVWIFFLRHLMKEKLPKEISNTKFKTIANVKWLLKYCSTDSRFSESLQGLPFLVTKDNVLRTIDERRPVFLTEYSDLVPNQCDKFVHPDLVTDIQKLKTKDTTFKSLRISSLASLLSTSAIPKNEETLLADIATIDKPWLLKLWAYLAKETKHIFGQSSRGPESMKKAVDAIDMILKPIDNWSIYPVRWNGKTMLIPLKQTKSVIDYEQGQMPDSLKAVLLQIQLPVPDYNFFMDSTGASSPIQLLKSIVTSVDKPHSVLYCIGQQTRKHGAVTLPQQNARAFLNYIAGNLPSIKKIPDAREILIRLPYYTTISKRQVKLEGAQAYLIPLSSRMPIDDVDKWENMEPPVLCIPSSTEPELNELFAYLGVQQGHEIHLYANFILQPEMFSGMTQSGRVAHLAYIRDELLPKAPHRSKGPTRSSIIEKLRDLEFIQDQNGAFHKASNFYDPNNKVFQIMQPDGPFLPDDFKESKWSGFLREIGLISEISEEQFVQYAKQIQRNEVSESEIAPATIDIHQQSQVLIDHFHQRHRYSDSFLDQIKGIRFIVPYDCGSLRQLHPQYLENPSGSLSHQLPLAQFEGSLPASKETSMLCWTNTVLIPQRATNLTMQQIERLGIVHSIPLDTVVSHLRILCDYMRSDDLSAEERRDLNRNELAVVFHSIYSHFNHNLDNIDTFKSQLEAMEFVLVGPGTDLVHPSQVVLHMMPEDELPPYLYRVPDEFIAYKKVFKKFGTVDQVTPKHYGTVLQDLYKTCRNSSMNPNEIIASFKAYAKLVEFLQTIPGQENKENPMKEVESLFLPCLKDGCISLSLSTDSVFIDNVRLHDRVKGLKENIVIDASMYLKSSDSRETFISEMLQNKLTTDKLRRFFRALPDSKKPTYFSHCFKEEIEPSSEERSQIYSEFARSLSAKIQSQEFQDGFLRLYKDAETSDKKDHITSEIEEHDQRQILGQISKIEIIGTKEVKTYIKFKGKRVLGSEKRKPIFYRKLKDARGEVAKYMLFIPGENTSKSIVLLKVSQFLNKITGDRLGDNSMHLVELFTKQLSCISQYLDDAEVAPLQGSMADSLHYSLPVLGDFIPTADHHLLNQSFDEFRQGEYVGKLISRFHIFNFINL